MFSSRSTPLPVTLVRFQCAVKPSEGGTSRLEAGCARNSFAERIGESCRSGARLGVAAAAEELAIISNASSDM